MKKPDILERLNNGVVIGDGGYLLELEKRGYVKAGPFTPEVATEHPEALRQLHREFFRAGSEVLQTCTFYASEEKLRSAGYADQVEQINRSAVRLAREVASDQALVAGNLCLTWQYQPDDPRSDDRVLNLFRQQVALQAEEGVDFFIAETFHYLGEAVLALQAIKEAGYAAMITFNFKQPAVSRDGFTPAQCAVKLEEKGADIVGANCGRDPVHMLPLVEEMRKAVKCHLAIQAAGFRCTDATPYFMGLPQFPLELDPLQLTRGEMADYARRARDMGINYIGACCGVTAAHIRSMAETLGRTTLASDKSPNLDIHPILGPEKVGTAAR
ncbi:MAG TPA: homocysteine S-methyltransferase family protein [Bryobacteraceae bacterium]|nr:homocysteine S-methyltransferase family protein [Bryobacteraceae bacterium]